MANIGSFTADKDGFTGTLRTLTLNVKVKLAPNDKGDNEKAPDFRLQAAGHDIGAAWKKTSEAGRDYISVTLDDPQGSSLDWAQRRSQQGLPRLFSAVGLARETLHQEAPELASRADHVVIDGPPRIAALARSALLAAERVLIPVQPSPYDLWASAEMVALIREAQVFRPALRAAFVINRRVSTTVIGREARQALADQPLPALRAEVHQRIVFADSVAAGRLARETAPDSAAAREITALVDELLRWPT